MKNTLSNQLLMQAKAIAGFAQSPSGKISEFINSILNKFLPWPFSANTASIYDAEGNNELFESCIYSNSSQNAKHPSTKISSTSATCAIQVLDILGSNEIQEGYAHIKVFKNLTRAPLPKTVIPINNVPLGIIFAIDSVSSIEEIADLILKTNENFQFTEWPDMVVILNKGIINYACQFQDQPMAGDFFLPGSSLSEVQAPPINVHLVGRGIGLSSFNYFFSFLYKHLVTFFPGIDYSKIDEAIASVPNHLITFGAYRFNIKHQLLPVPREAYSDRSLPCLPFRIEDNKGNNLAHINFIKWQDGGVIQSIGTLPLNKILFFLGPLAKGAQIIKQPNGEISSVLPIDENEFKVLLNRIQRRTKFRIRPEKPNWIIEKIGDEGSRSPFIARFYSGILRMRDLVFPTIETRKNFDKSYEFVLTTLNNTRKAASDIKETLSEHRRQIHSGEAVKLIENTIRIEQSINQKLQKLVDEFLNGAVRVIKDGMQRLCTTLDLNVGFLYNKSSTFSRAIAELAKDDPNLAEYLQATRTWSEPLVFIRNELHNGWLLPKMEYKNAPGQIVAIEPKINDLPVSQFVHYMMDRVCCFVEEISIYALQSKMPSMISVTEIPIIERKEDLPERFQVTFSDGGKKVWNIAYHKRRFDEV